MMYVMVLPQIKFDCVHIIASLECENIKYISLWQYSAELFSIIFQYNIL